MFPLLTADTLWAPSNHAVMLQQNYYHQGSYLVPRTVCHTNMKNLCGQLVLGLVQI